MLYKRLVFSSAKARSVQASNTTSQGTLAATKLQTALGSNTVTALPSLTTLIGSFSISALQLKYTMGSATLAAVACVTQQAMLKFAIDFGARQNDAAVQSAVQIAVASANSPLQVAATAVNMRLGMYNITTVFPGNNQVTADVASDAVYFYMLCVL